MRHPTRVAGVSFALFSAFAVSAMAHHSLEATYDSSKTITLSGTLAKVEWRNPHVSIAVDTKDPADGKPVQWRIETAAAFCMEKAGIARESLAVGSAVTVRNAPVARDGTRRAFVYGVSDGNKVVSLLPPGTVSALSPGMTTPSGLELKSVFDRRPTVQPNNPATLEGQARPFYMDCYNYQVKPLGESHKNLLLLRDRFPLTPNGTNESSRYWDSTWWFQRKGGRVESTAPCGKICGRDAAGARVPPMRSQTLFAGVSFAVLSAFAVSAMAHHSLEAEYDFSKTITLSGTLAKVGWQNPHVWIYVDAKDPADGKTAQWAIEMAAAVCMEKAGIAPESFAVGSAVTVRNAPAAKDGTRHTFVGSVSDGNKAVTVHQRNGLAATLELKSVFDRRPAVQPKPSPDPVTHEPTALAMGLGC